MRVTVTGATGMLGRRLVDELLDRGDEVTVLSRNSRRAEQLFGDRVQATTWISPKHAQPPAEALSGRDGVVNLLGESVAQRWTDSARREIRESRVSPTRQLVTALRALPDDERPGVLVSQSASGWYGPREGEPVTESEPAGDDFLARVCADWEAEASAASELPMRVALTRTGVVLSDSGGALEKMLRPFKAGVGGPVAGGRHYVPWIHLDDVAGALVFCLGNEAAEGPINLSGPQPVTNAELSKTLGRVLRRPAVLPVPGRALHLLYGEMAQIVTTGVRAMPARLSDLGYEHRHPELEPALTSLLRG